MSQSVRQRFDPSAAPSVSVFTEKVREGPLSFFSPLSEDYLNHLNVRMVETGLMILLRKSKSKQNTLRL